MCGFAGLLVLPIGVMETVVGLLTLVSPASARQLNKDLPSIQIPSRLLGNFASPILGGIAFFLLRDPEVAAYVEGY